MKKNSLIYAAKRHSLGTFLSDNIENDNALLITTIKQILENDNNELMRSALLDAERLLCGDYIRRKKFDSIESLFNAFLETGVEKVNKLEFEVFANVIKDKISILSSDKESKVKALDILQNYFSDLSEDNQQYDEIFNLLGSVEDIN